LLRAADVGAKRSCASLRRLQELNYYVNVVVEDADLTADSLEMLSDFSLVVLVNAPWALVEAANTFCVSRGIKFISTAVLGLFGHVFVDLGDTFEVLDKDGACIRSITPVDHVFIRESALF
jgi:ubiquitin-activating enzyme E1